MTRLRPALLLACLFPFAVMAQNGWRDMDGAPIPESESRKSRDGFSATVIVTPDQDWQEKWNTPPETIPYFSEENEVNAGGELFILTFLSNPATDSAGNTDVTCDFVVTRPDGSRSVAETDLPCFRGVLQGDPHNVYLSGASLKYVAEPEDPRGTWTVDVVVKDHHRAVQVPLRTSFVVN